MVYPSEKKQSTQSQRWPCQTAQSQEEILMNLKSNWEIYWKPRIECFFRGHKPRKYIFPDLEHLEKQGVLEKFLGLVITEDYKMERETYCFHCLKHFKTESCHVNDLLLSKGEITFYMKDKVLRILDEKRKEILWDCLQWDAWPQREALPICSTSRHERKRFPEVFGPRGRDDMIDVLGKDIMLMDNRTYYIAFTKHTGKRHYTTHDDCRITWELKKE